MSDLTSYDPTRWSNHREAILERLRQNDATLTTLYLSYNAIIDSGVKELAEALKTNTALTTLDLRNNQIKYRGAKELERASQTPCNIKFRISSRLIFIQR